MLKTLMPNVNESLQSKKVHLEVANLSTFLSNCQQKNISKN